MFRRHSIAIPTLHRAVQNRTYILSNPYKSLPFCWNLNNCDGSAIRLLLGLVFFLLYIYNLHSSTRFSKLTHHYLLTTPISPYRTLILKISFPEAGTLFQWFYDYLLKLNSEKNHSDEQLLYEEKMQWWFQSYFLDKIKEHPTENVSFLILVLNERLRATTFLE